MSFYVYVPALPLSMGKVNAPIAHQQGCNSSIPNLDNFVHSRYLKAVCVGKGKDLSPGKDGKDHDAPQMALFKRSQKPCGTAKEKWDVFLS